MKCFITHFEPPRLFALIFVLLLIFASPSCKEKCDEYYLGSLKYMNPYSGSETIIFSKDDKEDITFEGQFRSSTMNTTYPNNSSDICESIEFDDCKFREENDQFVFFIFLRPTTNNVSAHLSLVFKNYSYDNKSIVYEYIIEFNIPLDRDNLRPDQIYYDSLQINNSIQYEVYAAVPDPYKSSHRTDIIDTIIEPNRFYYNIQNGLLKIDFDDGSTWELKEILN